jgi:hypothetical protein
MTLAPSPQFVRPPAGLRTLDQQFTAFHRLNPWVYDTLVTLARDLVDHGQPRIGIGMLFEVMRWHWFMTTIDPVSEFKLNNNYRSRYARLIMDQEPDLFDVFEVRALRS